MIKIFIPQDKTQGKADIRGLWRNDTGKLYYDYIKIHTFNTPFDNIGYNNIDLLKKLSELKHRYNQEAIFYTCGGKAYIYYNNNKIDTLRYKISITVSRAELKQNIKHYLKLYGGITIEINKCFNYTDKKYFNEYIMTIWHNKKLINTKTKRQAKKHKLIRKLFNNILNYTGNIKHKDKIKFRISYNKHNTSYCKYKYDNDNNYIKTCIICLNLGILNDRIKNGYNDGYYIGRHDKINPLINNNKHNCIRFILLHELKHAIDYLEGSRLSERLLSELHADNYAIDNIRGV